MESEGPKPILTSKELAMQGKSPWLEALETKKQALYTPEKHTKKPEGTQLQEKREIQKPEPATIDVQSTESRVTEGRPVVNNEPVQKENLYRRYKNKLIASGWTGATVLLGYLGTSSLLSSLSYAEGNFQLALNQGLLNKPLNFLIFAIPTAGLAIRSWVRKQN